MNNLPSTAAVIVSAGLSSRMNAFKPMLPLAGATVIRTLINTLHKAGIEQIVVVTGRNSKELTEHIKDLHITAVENKNFATTDMFCSAKIGLSAIHDAEYVLFMPGDVPMFSPYSIADMLEYAAENSPDVLTPTYNKHNGHPVMLRASIIPSLITYEGSGGLKGAIAACAGKKEQLALPDQGLVMDADNPEDYALLLEYAKKQEEKETPHCEIKVVISGKEEFFDDTLARLLEAVDKSGSLTKACMQMGISYSNGWKKLKTAEEELSFRLLKSSRGGKNGGNSSLTKKGREFLTAYKKLANSTATWGKKQFNKYFGR